MEGGGGLVGGAMLGTVTARRGGPADAIACPGGKGACGLAAATGTKVLASAGAAGADGGLGLDPHFEWLEAKGQATGLSREGECEGTEGECEEAASVGETCWRCCPAFCLPCTSLLSTSSSFHGFCPRGSAA